MKTPQQQNESQRWREDESLRKKMEAHEVTPPSYLWDAIEQKLPAAGQRRSFMTLYFFAMAACLAGIGLYFFTVNKATDKGLITVNNKTTNKIEITDNLNTTNNESNISTTQIENNQPQSKIASAETKNETLNYIPKQNFISNQKPGSPLKKANMEENVKTTLITDDDVNKSAGNDNTVTETISVNKTPGNVAHPDNDPSTNPLKKVQKDKRHLWEIGFGTNLGYSYRFASKVDSLPHTTSINPNEDNKIELKEKGALASSFSMMTKYHFSKSLSIIAGLKYGKSAINSEIKQGYYLPSGNVYNSGTFTAYSDLGKSNVKSFSADTNIRSGSTLSGVFGEKTIPVKYYFRNFELPISLNYQMNLKKIGFYIEGGAQLKFIHKYNMEIYDSGSNSYTISDVKEPYNKLQAGFNFSTGLNIPMKKITLSAGPYFSGMLTNLNKNADSRIMLYDWGMAVRVWYGL